MCEKIYIMVSHEGQGYGVEYHKPVYKSKQEAIDKIESIEGLEKHENALSDDREFVWRKLLFIYHKMKQYEHYWIEEFEVI